LFQQCSIAIVIGNSAQDVLCLVKTEDFITVYTIGRGVLCFFLGFSFFLRFKTERLYFFGNLCFEPIHLTHILKVKCE